MSKKWTANLEVGQKAIERAINSLYQENILNGIKLKIDVSLTSSYENEEDNVIYIPPFQTRLYFNRNDDINLIAGDGGRRIYCNDDVDKARRKVFKGEFLNIIEFSARQIIKYVENLRDEK